MKYLIALFFISMLVLATCADETQNNPSAVAQDQANGGDQAVDDSSSSDSSEASDDSKRRKREVAPSREKRDDDDDELEYFNFWIQLLSLLILSLDLHHLDTNNCYHWKRLEPCKTSTLSFTSLLVLNIFNTLFCLFCNKRCLTKWKTCLIHWDNRNARWYHHAAVFPLWKQLRRWASARLK